MWHYYWKSLGGSTIGNRGLGMWGNYLFLDTPDQHLVSLDAATGKERWNQQKADYRGDLYATTAPTVIGNRVFTPAGGDYTDVPGWLESRDPETGALQWKWYATPRAGEPGIESWPSAFAAERGGAAPWQPATYDPELNLIYVGTGNPQPVLIGDSRPGDNLWTCSIVALNVDTGKMAWYFQVSPHDTHDWDATQTPVLFDAVVNGQRRKLLAQASRNGMFFLLDRVTGEKVLSTQYLPSANWSLGFKPTGEPIPDPKKEPQIGGALVSPHNGGATNWAPPSYSPQTGLFYVNTVEGYVVHYRIIGSDQVPNGYGGGVEQAVGGHGAALRAIDPLTGKERWAHKYPGVGRHGAAARSLRRPADDGRRPAVCRRILRPRDGDGREQRKDPLALGPDPADEQHADHLHARRHAVRARGRRRHALRVQHSALMTGSLGASFSSWVCSSLSGGGVSGVASSQRRGVRRPASAAR